MNDHNKELQELKGKLHVADSKLKELSESLSARESELKQQVDLLQRMQADFQNYMKHSEREKQRSALKAKEELIIKFINVCENIENAVKTLPAEAGRKTADGLKAVERGVHKILDDEGVVRMKSVGEVFDPSRHDAISAVKSKDKPDGIILEEVQSGYMMKDDVLRHAKVVVSRKEVE